MHHEAVPATQSGYTDSPAPPGWYICMCCSKEVWFVSQHSLKNMEEILGDGPLHEERWTGPDMDNNPAAGLISAPCVRRNRRSTARVLQNDLQQASNVHVTDQTVINKLHEGGIRDLCSQSSIKQHDWHLLVNTRISRATIGAPFSLQMRAGSH